MPPAVALTAPEAAARMVLGLHGKLPAHGDFVRRGLPGRFCEPWDAWLRQGVAAARASLGEPGFEAAWDAAPAWRFLLPPGACGLERVAGVLLPSRDQVGRRFPLTLATLAPPEGAAVSWPPPGTWFAALEGAALAGRDGGLNADALAALLPATWEAPPGDTLPGEIPAPGWWTADSVAGPGLVWPLPGLPAPADFVLLLEQSL